MAGSKVGRPRSEKSRNAIIEATDALLKDGCGAGLTIEAIAKRAGVGKPTIYRWWPSLADIVLDVLLRQADANIAVPAFQSLRETLVPFLRQSMKAIADGSGVHLRFLMSQAQIDDAFRDRFRDHFTARRREVLKSIFQQAVRHGQIGAARNLDILVDMVFGAMWYRLLTGHAPLDATFADELAEAVIGAAQAEGLSTPRRPRPARPPRG